MYVRINEENVREPDKYLSNFEKVNTRWAFWPGDYEYGSVMHYGPCFFSANNWETITAVVRKQTIFGEVSRPV